MKFQELGRFKKDGFEMRNGKKKCEIEPNDCYPASFMRLFGACVVSTAPATVPIPAPYWFFYWFFSFFFRNRGPVKRAITDESFRIP